MASEAPHASAPDCAPASSDIPQQDGGSTNGHGHDLKGHGFFALALGSVGVVFGDIGTSPLYAFKEALAAASHDGVTRSEIDLRRGVAGPLGADPDRDDQVRRLHHARRQQGRGRRAVADGPGATCHGQAHHPGLRPGRSRRGAVLWRRGDHAGHVGAVGGRGSSHHSRARTWRDQRGRAADRHGDAAGPVLHPEPGHRLGRQAVRPGLRRVVRCHVLAGPDEPGGQSRHPDGHQPLLCGRVPGRARPDRLHRAGRGVPDRDRGRGPDRRHGPLRPLADPGRLAVLRAAVPGHELSGSGRLRPHDA